MTRGQPSGFVVFAKLVRLQFIPVMVAPVALGAAAAWYLTSRFNASNFLLALAGSISLHLAANAIDDVYDHVNGVDSVSDKIFPREFPGWKPLTRGMISLKGGFEASGILYVFSLVVGLYLSLTVGWFALGIAIPGILLSYFYAAPPVRLDYRGLGMGELSIFLSFGPIPCLGTYYVLTGGLSLIPLILSIPTGLLTTSVLLSHDKIFFDAYREAGKRSLAVVLGRNLTNKLIFALGLVAYLLVFLFILLGYAPVYAAAVLLTIPLFVGAVDLAGRDASPPEHARRTMRAFVQSVTFTLLLSLALLL
ncbi:MAG: prenyltransferase [Thaumarchaeota archaeon]|nr:MAG: prenyltransferase [Nitrososphaerota archaeon]